MLAYLVFIKDSNRICIWISRSSWTLTHILQETFLIYRVGTFKFTFKTFFTGI